MIDLHDLNSDLETLRMLLELYVEEREENCDKKMFILIDRMKKTVEIELEKNHG